MLTFEELVFPNIEQEIVVFIGEKGAEEKGIRIIELNYIRRVSKYQVILDCIFI
mgnify:CR=1 FL=1